MTSHAVRWHTLIVVLLMTAVVLLLMQANAARDRYRELQDEVRDACSATGAAAKLDLSSWVPLCKDVAEESS